MFRGKKAFLYVGGPFLALHLILAVLFYTVVFKPLDVDLRCAYIVIYMFAVTDAWSVSFSVTDCLCEAEDDAKLRKIKYTGESVWILVLFLVNMILFFVYDMCASRHHTDMRWVMERLKCMIILADWAICDICNKAYRKSQVKKELAG